MARLRWLWTDAPHSVAVTSFQEWIISADANCAAALKRWTLGVETATLVTRPLKVELGKCDVSGSSGAAVLVGGFTPFGAKTDVAPGTPGTPVVAQSFYVRLSVGHEKVTYAYEDEWVFINTGVFLRVTNPTGNPTINVTFSCQWEE